MNMPLETFLAPIIILSSDISSSTTGMGIGIISTSYFSLIYPPIDAVLLGLYVFTISNILILLQFKKHIDKNFLIKFIPLTIPGIIIGTAALTNLEASLIRPFFGILLLLIVFVTISGKSKAVFTGKKLSMALFASIIGFTSAFMNASSPFVVLMLLFLGYTKKDLVATATACYFVNNLIKLAAFSYIGLFSIKMAKLSLYFLPFIVAGILAGKILIDKIPINHFRNIIAAFLFIFGIVLMLGY